MGVQPRCAIADTCRLIFREYGQAQTMKKRFGNVLISFCLFNAQSIKKLICLLGSSSSCFFVVCWLFFKINFFEKLFQKYHECRALRIQISVQVTVVCKGNQQTTQTGKRAMTWDFQQCDICNQQRLRPACAYAQSDQSLCWSLEYSMTVKILSEQRLESLSLKEGCTGSSESTLIKNTTLLEITCHGSNS